MERESSRCISTCPLYTMLYSDLQLMPPAFDRSVSPLVVLNNQVGLFLSVTRTRYVHARGDAILWSFPLYFLPCRSSSLTRAQSSSDGIERGWDRAGFLSIYKKNFTCKIVFIVLLFIKKILDAFILRKKRKLKESVVKRTFGSFGTSCTYL